MACPAAAADIETIRDASRRLVRELGFMRGTLAGTKLPPSAVHALVEIGGRGTMTAAALCEALVLEKSSVSRMLRKLLAAGEVEAAAHDRDGRAECLSLTAKGRATLDGIDHFARSQVGDALACLPGPAGAAVSGGLSAYARALTLSRTGCAAPPDPAVQVWAGYQPGVIGRATEMHARFYSRAAGFDRVFERKVASEVAAFVERLDRPCNQIWTASCRGAIVGTIAIDGEDFGPGIAHLRWFIVDDGLRGSGAGRKMLEEAVAFCDRRRFHETHLWTFRGLDAARRLYEATGFALAEERPGSQWGKEVVEQRFVRSGEPPPV